MLIVGLANLNTERSNAISFEWANRWVYNNFVAFNKSGLMYEKYSALEIGIGGSGGEYVVQTGFGWSNGAVLDLFRMYGDRLSSSGIY